MNRSVSSDAVMVNLVPSPASQSRGRFRHCSLRGIEDKVNSLIVAPPDSARQSPGRSPQDGQALAHDTLHRSDHFLHRAGVAFPRDGRAELLMAPASPVRGNLGRHCKVAREHAYIIGDQETGLIEEDEPRAIEGRAHDLL